MTLDLQAAATEYLGWLQLEANRSPNTVRAYQSELRKLIDFLTANGHSLALDQVRHDDLRAYQRHLAGRLKSPASRARALVAIRSWLRWLAREGLIEKDLSNGITLPKLEQRLPKPIDPDELTRLLAALPHETTAEKRDRAMVQFLISTGCRISEALALDRTDFPRSGNRLVVTGKGSKQRTVQFHRQLPSRSSWAKDSSRIAIAVSASSCSMERGGLMRKCGLYTMLMRPRRRLI